MSKLNSVFKDGGAGSDLVARAMVQFEEASTQGAGAIENNIRGLQDLSREAKNTAAAMGSLIEAEEKNVESSATNATKQYTDALEQESSAAFTAKTANDELNNSLASTGAQQSRIQNFINLTGAVTSYIFAVQSLKNIGSIINDEDLSTGEKMEEVIMALSMGIMMAIPAFKDLSAAITNTRLAEMVGTRTKLASVSATRANVAALKGEEVAQKMDTIAKREGKEAALAFAASEGVAASGAGVLSAALAGVMIVITGLIMAWQAYSSNIEATKEKEKELREEAKATADEAYAAADN